MMIEQMENKLAGQSNAIKTIEVTYEKLKAKVKGLEARNFTKNKQIKNLQAKNKELDMKVQELETMGKQQMRKCYDIDRDRAVAIAYNKKLQENIIEFETERATKNKEFKNVEAQNQELSKKVESLESELDITRQICKRLFRLLTNPG
mmetsp:Transcript_8514/g.12131  ORF Transcript_8514/g.12131 Transcript_8514/m.12131 type:complete len:148 (-) Transcript_8514:194-637(-)